MSTQSDNAVYGRLNSHGPAGNHPENPRTEEADASSGCMRGCEGPRRQHKNIFGWKIIGIVATISLVMTVRTEFAFGLDIVKDGKPVARIVIPDNADKYTTQAAEWIQQYVKTGTGAELPILSESKDQGSGPRMCVGATRAAGKVGIRGDMIPLAGCRLAVKGDTLFLLGRDEQSLANASSYASKGTCKAAVTFLEDFCGVRWLAPTLLGEVVPQTNNISVPSDLDRTLVPAFQYALLKIYGVGSPATYANNFHRALRLYSVGGHTWNIWIPGDKYYKDHPEYFALINGKRIGPKDVQNDNSHLCTSNPDVKRLLLESLRQKFDEGYDLVQLGQTDGWRPCECPACQAMDKKLGIEGDPTERIKILHRDIAKECLKSHPDKKIHMLIYMPTATPSKKFDKWPDNVVLELCSWTHEGLPPMLETWKGKAKAFTFYAYYWGTYHPTGPGPKCTAYQVAEYLRYLRDNNFLGIYFCGGGECWGLEGHSYYACGKLMGNPDLDPKELVKEYCDGVLGKAAPAMLQFFNALDDRVQCTKKFEEIRSKDFRQAEPVYTAIYPPAVLDQLENLLKRAEGMADDERSRMWVGLTRMSFDYVKLTANVFTVYHAFQVNQNRESLIQLKEIVEKWRAHRDKILNLPQADVDRWFPGHKSWVGFFNTGTGSGGRLRSIIRAPFDWDFDKLMAKYASGAPQGPAKLVVARILQAPVIDGVIGEDEWKAVVPANVNLMQGTPATVPTKVRLAFDDKNIYVAFTCSEPDINKLRLKNLKHDGHIWDLDCVEIFFDPEAGCSRYLHFIVAPEKDAFYDARLGYVGDDPAHPLYGKTDPGWNPDWKYAFKVDAGKKEWTVEAEFPFASLGVTPPGQGARWKGNFGRERYAGLKAGGNDPECFLWSPNILNTGFADPLCFGDLYFEKAPDAK